MPPYQMRGGVGTRYKQLGTLALRKYPMFFSCLLQIQTSMQLTDVKRFFFLKQCIQNMTQHVQASAEKQIVATANNGTVEF